VNWIAVFLLGGHPVVAGPVQDVETCLTIIVVGLKYKDPITKAYCYNLQTKEVKKLKGVQS
jgi:hypothetical protein